MLKLSTHITRQRTLHILAKIEVFDRAEYKAQLLTVDHQVKSGFKNCSQTSDLSTLIQQSYIIQLYIVHFIFKLLLEKLKFISPDVVET